MAVTDIKRWKHAGKAAAWVLGVLTGIAALTVGATGPEGKPWRELGAGALGIVIIVFLVALVWPELRTGWRRIRDYPGLEVRVTQLEKAAGNALGERDDARNELSDLRQKLPVERRAGQLQIIGSLLAVQSKAQLVPVGVTVAADGGLRIVAEPEEVGSVPPIRARFLARTSTLGTVRGVLTVIDVESEGRRVHLAVAETAQGSDSFWQKLSSDAAEHEQAPDIKIVADPLAAQLIENLED